MNAEAIQKTKTRHNDDEVHLGPPNNVAAPFLTIQNIPVHFQEDWSTGVGGGLWSTGLAMAKYFASNDSNALANIRALAQRKNGPLNVLELGSGNGCLAVCLAALAKDYIHKMYVTDTLDHLEMINYTLSKNLHILYLPDELAVGEDQSDNNNGKVMSYIVEHVWGQFEVFHSSNSNVSASSKIKLELNKTQFDLIIGSDLAYRQELYNPLVQSLLHFSTDKTTSLIGVTMVDTTPDFFILLEQSGFRYERLAEHLLMPEYRGSTFGVFVIQKK